MLKIALLAKGAKTRRNEDGIMALAIITGIILLIAGGAFFVVLPIGGILESVKLVTSGACDIDSLLCSALGTGIAYILGLTSLTCGILNYFTPNRSDDVEGKERYRKKAPLVILGMLVSLVSVISLTTIGIITISTLPIVSGICFKNSAFFLKLSANSLSNN